MFFFGSQEFTNDARPTPTSTANYPTALERIGDFSQTRLTTTANYGAIQPIIDYKTGQPFPGNIIPADRINPIGQKLLNLLIQPNGYVPPGANQQYNANFIIQRDAGTQPHRLRVPHGRGADQPVAVQLQGARGSGKQHPRQRVQPGRRQVEQHGAGVADVRHGHDRHQSDDGQRVERRIHHQPLQPARISERLRLHADLLRQASACARRASRPTAPTTATTIRRRTRRARHASTASSWTSIRTCRSSRRPAAIAPACRLQPGDHQWPRDADLQPRSAVPVPG